MSTRTLRRWLPLAILAFIAVGAWSGAGAANLDDPMLSPVVYDESLTTPMFSARRVPQTLQQPIADDAVVADAQTFFAKLARETPDGATWCVTVDIDGRRLVSANDELGLIPASNMKVLTTYAALELLGAETRFRTTVAAPLPIVDGVLDGDLFLIGDGDPFLSTAGFRQEFADQPPRAFSSLEDLADRIVALGLTRIEGAVVGDGSAFDELRLVPTWPERFQNLSQTGPLGGLVVDNGVVSWPEGQFSYRATLAEDPAAHAAAEFDDLLEARGVTIVGRARAEVAPTTAIELAGVESASVAEMVTHVNSHSDNHGAEALLKQIGRATSGEGSTEAGATAVLGVLIERAGVDTTGLVVSDGSGLAESNRVPCRLFVDLLDSQPFDGLLAQSMAIGGTRGTLADRFLPPSAGNGVVYAKTGTLNPAVGLSGYVQTAADPTVVARFAYLLNGELIGITEGVRTLPDDFVAALTSYPAAPPLAEFAPRPTSPAG